MESPQVHGLPMRLPVIGMPPFSTPEDDAHEEDDSFFELELAFPDSPGDKLLSKRKILPIEGLKRPLSPISLLKSAPKFRVFQSAQSKSTAATEAIRGNSLKRSGSSRNADPPTDGTGGSKRFSREVILKYLRLLKPLYVRVVVSKKHSGGSGSKRETVSEVVPNPTESSKGKPPTGPPRLKQLGKSRSASAATRAESPARMDDSLAQLHDGIQSAILHCKRSLSASRDFSPIITI